MNVSDGFRFCFVYFKMREIATGLMLMGMIQEKGKNGSPEESWEHCWRDSEAYCGQADRQDLVQKRKRWPWVGT